MKLCAEKKAGRACHQVLAKVVPNKDLSGKAFKKEGEDDHTEMLQAASMTIEKMETELKDGGYVNCQERMWG